jgi:AcrR family transcriptional regulator
MTSDGTSRTPNEPLPTRARQRADTRNLIFRVAMEEIGEVGLAKARIEHIARKAGVTRPTFYAHFPTKEDLLRELQARTEETTLRALRRQLSQRDGAGLAHRVVDAIFELMGRANGVLRREAFGLMVRDPRGSDWMGSALFEFLTQEFAEAQERREIAATMRPDELTRIVMTAIFGFLVVESGPAKARRALAHRMVAMLLEGAAHEQTTGVE